MKFKVQVEMKSIYTFDIKADNSNDAITKAMEKIANKETGTPSAHMRIVRA